MHAFLFSSQSIKCHLYAGSSRIDSGKSSSCDRHLALVVIVQRSASNSSSCLGLGVVYLAQCDEQMTRCISPMRIEDASKREQKEREEERGNGRMKCMHQRRRMDIAQRM